MHTKKLRVVISYALSIIVLLSFTKSGSANPAENSTTGTNTQSYEFCLEWEKINISQVQGKTCLDIPGFQLLHIPGAPIIPYQKLTFPINTLFEIYLIETEWVICEGNQNDFSIENMVTFPKAQICGSREEKIALSLPGNPVDYRIVGSEKQPMASICIFPFQWRGGILHYLKKVQFEIVFSSKTLKRVNQDGNIEKEIIFAPDEWKNPAERLQELHREKLIESRIVYLSEMNLYPVSVKKRSFGRQLGLENVKKEYWGPLANWDVSLSKKIQSFLIDTMEEEDISYITLLGDGSVIPPSFYAFEEMPVENMADFYNGVVPTDFFYMAPNSTSNTLLLETSLGRIPARDLREAEACVEKIACWTEALRWEWFKNVAMIGGDLFHGDYVGELFCQNLIDNNYFLNMNVQKFYATENFCNQDELGKVLEKGNTGFINIAAHGSGSEVRLEPGFIDARDIASLEQKAELPIIFSYSCMNGSYDTRLSGINYESDPAFAYPTSFGESLVLSPGGSIAYIGGSRVNYSSFYVENTPSGRVQYLYPGQMDAMGDYFFESYLTENSLGNMCKSTLEKYANNHWENDYNNHSFIGFTLLGDPLLGLCWSETKPTRSRLKATVNKVIHPSPDMELENIGPFLSLDEKASIHIEDCSRFIISDYERPGTILFDYISSNKKEYVELPSIPRSRICMRFIDDNDQEKRYVFHATPSQEFSLFHPYTICKEYYPEETIPYKFQLKNEGFVPLDNLQCEIVLEDTSTNTVFKKILLFDSLQPFEEIVSSIPIPLTKKEGIYQLTNTIEGNNKEGTIVLRKKAIFPIHVNQNSLLRIGIPVTTWALKKTKDSIDEVALNDQWSSRDMRIEACYFPVDFLSDYSFTSLVLFDYYWVSWYGGVGKFLTRCETFTTKGGVVFGCSANSFFPDQNKKIKEFFGIPTEILFSTTNYSRFLKPLYQVKEKSSLQFPFYYVQTRANWEPFSPSSWKDISLSKECELLACSKDGKNGLLKNKDNRYFLSNSFLTMDPTGKEDQVVQLWEDIFLSSSKTMVPFTTILRDPCYDNNES